MPPFDKPFQPAPEFHYSQLFGTATPHEADSQLNGPISDLEEYASKMGLLTQQMERFLTKENSIGSSHADLRQALTGELIRALEVSALRANHRALTLRALSARVSERAGTDGQGRINSKKWLANARLVRFKALALVKQQESVYRYPIELVARQRDSLTAYPFGYLYPAGRLFFWEREEKQVEQGRFDPLFMNLWDFSRTLGLGSLFFR